MKETIDEGTVGWLVNSVEEMVEVIKNPHGDPGVSLEDMREYSVEWARQFSIENMVSRYEELCIEALDKGGW